MLHIIVGDTPLTLGGDSCNKVGDEYHQAFCDISAEFRWAFWQPVVPESISVVGQDEPP
jgi:hypothetical protein